MKSNIVGKLEKALVEFEMLRRGWGTRDLAERCEVDANSFANDFTNRFPSLPTRYRVEKAFGFIPIWSDAITVALRKRCFQALGFDPYLITFPELKSQARRAGIVPGDKNSTELRDQFLGWLAANPNLDKKPVHDPR